jgi:hypothetical protein
MYVNVMSFPSLNFAKVISFILSNQIQSIKPQFIVKLKRKSFRTNLIFDQFVKEKFCLVSIFYFSEKCCCGQCKHYGS